MSEHLLIGGHVSAAGGVQNAPERAAAIGANCAQIFVSAPQGWRTFDIADEQINEFRSKCQEHGIGSVYIHALYLLNLATDDHELLTKSINALTYALTMSAKLGVAGVVYHTGSYKQQDRATALANVIDRVKQILKATPEDSILLMENSAGEAEGHKIGGTFEEAAEILNAVNSPRFQYCFDTQHAFGAGYDLRTAVAVDTAIADLDRTIGIDRVAVIHMNDSKVELASHRDRHENIGEGFIGNDGLRALLHHPKLRSKPWILEVPGMHDEIDGAVNVTRLKKLAA